MLPERLLLHDVRGNEVLAAYLREPDLPWVSALFELVRQHEGRPWRDLLAATRNLPLPLTATARGAAAPVLHVLDKVCAPSRRPMLPARARRELFLARARSDAPSDDIVAAVARQLDVTPRELERSLFADSPRERPVGRVPDELDAPGLLLLVNLRLAQGLVARAERMTIDMQGRVRRVVQHATWQGLLCVARGPDPARCRIEISGPLAPLRATRLYGRALASVVPILPWCGRFRLSADIRVGSRPLSFRLDDACPIGRGTEPRIHDSRLEADFESDMRRLAPGWEVTREPLAVPIGDTFVFPDFAVGPREMTGRVLVEIAGWWTRDYLEAKLASLRAARCERLIVCVVQRAGRLVGDVSGLDVLTSRRRVDAALVLARARELLGTGE